MSARDDVLAPPRESQHAIRPLQSTVEPYGCVRPRAEIVEGVRKAQRQCFGEGRGNSVGHYHAFHEQRIPIPDSSQRELSARDGNFLRGQIRHVHDGLRGTPGRKPKDDRRADGRCPTAQPIRWIAKKRIATSTTPDMSGRRGLRGVHPERGDERDKT